MYAGLRPCGGQSGKYLDASGESALGPCAVCGALTPSCKRHPCGWIRGCPALGPCPPSPARASRCRASAQSSNQRVRRAVFTCLARGPASGPGGPQGQPGSTAQAPPPAPQLCPSCPGLGSTLTTSCPSWRPYSSAAGRVLPLQTPQPSLPATPGRTEPSHPAGRSASWDGSLSPPSRARPEAPAPKLPSCDSRTQPLPLTTRETGRRAQPPAPRPPGPEPRLSPAQLPPERTGPARPPCRWDPPQRP